MERARRCPWRAPGRIRGGSLRPNRGSRLLLACAILPWAPVAAAQNNVGELLDAGASVMSADEFRQQVVQRVLIGPIPSGASNGTVEFVYTADGTVQGMGFVAQDIAVRFSAPAPLAGRWTIDDMGRVCTSIQIIAMKSPQTPQVNLPPRCQFWFKRGDQYFLSDSDSDRSARVLPRTVKQ